jgi:hypothetical protein
VVNVRLINYYLSFGKYLFIIFRFYPCLFSLLGTPTISEWPEIAQCLYYQTGLPRFPLDDVQLSRLPMSIECRQFLKVKFIDLFSN